MTIYCYSVATLCPMLCNHIDCRVLWPPLSHRVCSNSCLLVGWCYLTISSSAASFSFYLQSFPASGYPSWITALSRQRGLCNSMKLWTILCRATQDGWVTVKSSDKTWSTGGGYVNHSSILASRTPTPIRSWTAQVRVHMSCSVVLAAIMDLGTQ